MPVDEKSKLENHKKTVELIDYALQSGFTLECFAEKCKFMHKFYELQRSAVDENCFDAVLIVPKSDLTPERISDITANTVNLFRVSKQFVDIAHKSTPEGCVSISFTNQNASWTATLTSRERIDMQVKIYTSVVDVKSEKPYQITITKSCDHPDCQAITPSLCSQSTLVVAGRPASFVHPILGESTNKISKKLENQH
jgi:hypothetical protein